MKKRTIIKSILAPPLFVAAIVSERLFRRRTNQRLRILLQPSINLLRDSGPLGAKLASTVDKTTLLFLNDWLFDIVHISITKSAPSNHRVMASAQELHWGYWKLRSLIILRRQDMTERRLSKEHLTEILAHEATHVEESDPRSPFHIPEQPQKTFFARSEGQAYHHEGKVMFDIAVNVIQAKYGPTNGNFLRRIRPAKDAASQPAETVAQRPMKAAPPPLAPSSNIIELHVPRPVVVGFGLSMAVTEIFSHSVRMAYLTSQIMVVREILPIRMANCGIPVPTGPQTQEGRARWGYPAMWPFKTPPVPHPPYRYAHKVVAYGERPHEEIKAAQPLRLSRNQTSSFERLTESVAYTVHRAQYGFKRAAAQWDRPRPI